MGNLMNERELGAAKAAAESWINIATGRPLDGLLEGCSMAIVILDPEGEVLFERRKGSVFDARREAPIPGDDEDTPIPYSLIEQEKEDAVQVASAAAEVSRDGSAGGNLPEDGQGVRPSEQGEEASQAGQEEAVEPTPEP